jgi:endonuclease YncB( thermonuclease family)
MLATMLERIVLLGISSLAFAVETKPVKVLKVIDGDTIEVASDLGGQNHPVRVRLLYVDTPESKDNDHGKGSTDGKAAAEWLSKELPAGTEVTLWGPNDALEVDGYGRVLAVAYHTMESAFKMIVREDEAQECIPEHVNVNEQIIEAGYSPVWLKWSKPPPEMLERFRIAEGIAEHEKVGVWGTNPQWMKDKSNERTVPRRKQESDD